MPATRTEYEFLVRGLSDLVAEMKGGNLEPEDIARALHSKRQKLAMRFRALTPEPIRSLIRERTLRTYGNDTGPSIGFLRARGKSWEQIIESAIRPGRLPSVDDDRFAQ